MRGGPGNEQERPRARAIAFASEGSSGDIAEALEGSRQDERPRTKQHQGALKVCTGNPDAAQFGSKAGMAAGMALHQATRRPSSSSATRYGASTARLSCGTTTWQRLRRRTPTRARAANRRRPRGREAVDCMVQAGPSRQLERAGAVLVRRVERLRQLRGRRVVTRLQGFFHFTQMVGRALADWLWLPVRLPHRAWA